MKRFDRAIKVLKDEKFRIIGKVACDYHDRQTPIGLSVRTRMARYINEAIKILQEHPTNKQV